MLRFRMSEQGPSTRSKRERSSLTHLRGPRDTTVAARGLSSSNAISPAGKHTHTHTHTHTDKHQPELVYQLWQTTKAHKRFQTTLFYLDNTKCITMLAVIFASDSLRFRSCFFFSFFLSGKQTMEFRMGSVVTKRPPPKVLHQS